MLIALDYDGTYTADPGLWHPFITALRSRGHRVFVVTMRFPSEGREVEQRLGRHVDRIIFTAREAKRRHLQRLGHDVDVWIDNHPEYIDGDAPPATLAGVRRSARWGAVAGRIFRFVWPERPAKEGATPVREPGGTAHAEPVGEAVTIDGERPSERLVVVYGFKVWSESQGRYRISKYKAPREVLARYDVEILTETAQVIARSELDGKGRYLSEENRFVESSFRSSSFDLQSGLQVIEEPHGAPGADAAAAAKSRTATSG